MYATIEKAAGQIRKEIDFDPEIGIILGTGLGGLVREIDIKHSLSYTGIEGFPVSTVESHKGRLIFGYLNNRKIVAMQGRFHYYEGYSMQQVVMPVRVMKLLGIKALLVSNACGAVVPRIRTGDLVVLDDHINLQPGNPLTGANIDAFGPRFPDMSCPYDKTMIKKALDIANRNNISITSGVYASVPGPNLETRAEYRYLRTIGADVVGMSTVPEIIAARHMGLPCFAISVVTDEGWHEDLKPVTLEEVIRAANETEPKMTLIIKELVSQI
jgi:purine-nucleoside phosphorylase